jgi:DNA repair protein RecO
MNQIVTTGIILSRTNYGEADRIITILTPDQGKIRLIGKGVRRIKSKLAGGIELFSISDITYIAGRGDIGTLISSRLKVHYGKIAMNIDRTMYGYEMLKRINKVTEDMADNEYFKLMGDSLEALDEPDLLLESLRLWFNLQLLKLAGHSPNLHTDDDGKRLIGGQTYSFSVDNMNFSGPSGRYNANHIKLLRLIISLDSPLKLRQVGDIESVLNDCLNLVRTMLQQFIRN